MASPFHVFRKNQKMMIATLGLLAIGAFVFLTPIAMYQGAWQGGAGGDNPVVVTTKKYGDLTERDIDNMQARKQRLLGFLTDLISVTSQDNYQAALRNQQLIRQIFGDTSEKAVVNTWLLAQQAKAEGMHVSDRDVADFLNALTDNQADLNLIQKSQVHSRLDEDILFDMLQQELLAIYLQRSFATSVYPTTPGQRWDYFQRLNRKVSAQVSPVEVAGFVAEVPEPTEEELKAFFEEHKNTIPVKNTPTPGFRVPEMVDVEYIKADYDQFDDLESVTDEEIEQYYLANRERFKVVDLPGLPKDFSLPEDMIPEASDMLRGLKKGIGSTAPAETAPAEETTTPKPAAADTKKPAEPAKQETAPEKKETPKVKAPQADKTPESSESEETKAAPKTSGVTRSAFRLVSMQQEKAADAPASEKPADTKPADTKAETTETKVEEKAAPPISDTPGRKITPATIGAGLSELNAPASGAPTISGTSYKPLEEAKDEIRRLLVLQKARERIEKALAKAKKEIRDHHDQLTISDEELSEEAIRERLSAFIKNLAEKSKLTYVRTGLLSPTDLYETDLGKSTVKDLYQPVAAIIIERTSDQQFRIASDMDQNHYLFWRVKKTDEKTPDLEDEGIRDKVIQAWKQTKARELAVEKAERLAKVARESGQSLRNSIGKSENVPVQATGRFSWVQHQLAPGVGQTLRAGRPENVDSPGPDFMKAVYGLQPQGVTVAMNYPQTIAYVVQLTNTTPDNKLWVVFKNDNYANYQGIARGDLQQAMFQWIEGLEKAAGLDWKRSPARPAPQRR